MAKIAAMIRDFFLKDVLNSYDERIKSLEERVAILTEKTAEVKINQPGPDKILLDPPMVLKESVVFAIKSHKT